MSAPLAGKFQDHYAILGVTRTATHDEIHKAYTEMAKQVGPMAGPKRDPEKFKAVNEAYEVLSDKQARETFDALLPKPAQEAPIVFSGEEFFSEFHAEGQRRAALLCLLYDRRRTTPSTPGLSYRQIETILNIDSKQLAFSLWYLIKRGLVMPNDKSSMEITVEGMEYLEHNVPNAVDVMSMVRPERLAS